MTSPTTYKLGYPKLKYPLVPYAGTFSTDPTSANVLDPKAGGNYPIGTMWVNKSTNGV